VDSGSGPKEDTQVLPALEAEGRSLKGDEVRAAFPGFASFVDPAVAVATRAAEGQVAALARRAREAIEVERQATLSRLRLTLGHQGLSEEELQGQLEAEERHYEALLGALGGLRVALDSACGFVINR
jgi:ATP-dependent helicase HepA